ncbi:unnamed protein product [Albugo candida]|uniref:CRAL-TRIO domain-containing protein n=1 Tax=Albugo candida TaxID=65357 RepID=A0A024GRA4_9STRA|nr:unnamed protein product [Albugo candida]|eukprot:CCI49088.1 unnamed protein product [Albugo candida]
MRVCDLCVRQLIQKRAGYRSSRTSKDMDNSSGKAASLQSQNASEISNVNVKAESDEDEKARCVSNGRGITRDSQMSNSEPMAIASDENAEKNESESLCGILYSCILEEQANIMDEILYLGTFRMAGHSFASRSMSANVALWKDRMFMLTPAELLCFKNSEDTTALGEVRTCIHLTDILHVEVNDQFPRILTIVRSDGRFCRLRAKTAEQCAEIRQVLNRARAMFEDAMHRLHRGIRPNDFCISCVTIQHESSLPETVVASSPAFGDRLQVDMYPSSILRFYVNGPYANGMALVSSETLVDVNGAIGKDVVVESETLCTAPSDQGVLYTHIRSTQLHCDSSIEFWSLGVWGLYISLTLAFHLQNHSLFVPMTCALIMSSFVWRNPLPLSLMAATRRLQHVSRFQVVCTRIVAGPTENDTADSPVSDAEVDARFVEACGGDMEEAKRRYKQTLNWRMEHNMDNALLRPLAHFSIMKQAHANYIHKRGKKGHLVTFEHLGSMKASREHWLRHGISEKDAIMYHMISQEFLWRVLDPRPFPNGTQIKVVDLQGISMADVGGEVFAYMKTLGQTVAEYNPERIFFMIVLNPPSWFSLIWKLVSPLVDPKTRERVQVLRGEKDIARGLLECIDEENLPQQYGGTCQCEGGCISGSPEEKDFHEYMAKVNAGEECADVLEALCAKYRFIVDDFEV